MERLTTSEAAVAAGVSIPQIHRIIDEKILPETCIAPRKCGHSEPMLAF